MNYILWFVFYSVHLLVNILDTVQWMSVMKETISWQLKYIKFLKPKQFCVSDLQHLSLFKLSLGCQKHFYYLPKFTQDYSNDTKYWKQANLSYNTFVMAISS
jgi:hypothetical protein